MKKLIIFALLITLIPTSAHAEETGAWVKVDVNGNAIGQAIVCTQSVCGDPASLYNKLTLGSNERYVLQAPASVDGNVAGVGASQGMDSVKVDLQTGVWTTTQSNKYIDPLTQKPVVSVSVQQFTSDTAPWVSKPFVPTQSALIAQQEATIADLYAQMAKLKNAKKIKKAKK
jgi:hypothetical protein